VTFVSSFLVPQNKFASRKPKGQDALLVSSAPLHLPRTLGRIFLLPLLPSPSSRSTFAEITTDRCHLLTSISLPLYSPISRATATSPFVVRTFYNRVDPCHCGILESHPRERLLIQSDSRSHWIPPGVHVLAPPATVPGTIHL
jgi:hypothetical protein